MLLYDKGESLKSVQSRHELTFESYYAKTRRCSGLNS